MSKSRNPEITRDKLLKALQRLVEGEPQRLSHKYKINIKSVQEEAGLSLGTAYRHPDVMDAIEKEKAKQQKSTRQRNTNSEIKRLRKEKAKESMLKEKYRNELNEAEKRLDLLYAEQNMQLMAMFNFLDIEDKAQLLKSTGNNVVSIRDPF